jgi:predicted HNH restriction endonuclease
MYQGRCQLCLWDPRDKYGESLCHGHHLRWLSRGGEDILGNMILICPNHHSAIHGCDAPFDYRDLAFEFDHHREPLQVNVHIVN